MYLFKFCSKKDVHKAFFFVRIRTSIYVLDFPQSYLYSTCENNTF